jgi:hypothetical protein
MSGLPHNVPSVSLSDSQVLHIFGLQGATVNGHVNGHTLVPSSGGIFIPDIDDVALLRARLWEGGFRPIAVYNSNVGPTDDAKGKAPKGKEWQIRARKDPPEAAIRQPELDALNTGILCDGLRVIDIDIDNPTLAEAVKSKALGRWGECPIRTRDNANGRCALLYRAAEGAPEKRSIAGRLGKVEALGHGQQFVAFGVHPTGAELKWIYEAPGDIELGDLTAISEDEITSFLQDCAEIIGAEAPKEHRAGGWRDFLNSGTSVHGLHAEARRLMEALFKIPNIGPGTNWDEWNKVGMALWAATSGSEAGRAMFHTWSEQHPSYSAKTTNERWDHYRSSPATKKGAGSIFHLATEAEKVRAAESESETETTAEWPEPLDFLAADDLTGAPELRPEHLPAAIAPFVFDTATRMGVDPAAVALSALVSLASVVSDDWQIQPKVHDTTWTEAPRIWGAIVGDPSMRKSPVITTVTKPIDRMEAEARKLHADDMRRYKAEMKHWKDNGSNPETEPKRPRLPRYLVEGTTVEALTEVLRDDSDATQCAPAGKVLVRQDEMAGWIASFDCYRAGGRGGGDRSAYTPL